MLLLWPLLLFLPSPAHLLQDGTESLQTRNQRVSRDTKSQPIKVLISEPCTQGDSADPTQGKEVDLDPGSPLVLTHRIRLVPGSGAGCAGCEAEFAALRERLERLEREVSALREKCGGSEGGCCSPQQSQGAGCTTVRPETDGCPDECSDQGRCVDGKCVCFPGFSGPDCSISSCPSNCNNKGKCVNGQCVCDPGYTGPDCSANACPNNCNNRGRCVNGKCVCDTGFTGPDCSTNACPNNCNNKGRCVNGKCVCNAGFTGSDCAAKTCPRNCNNKGRCVNGKCVCDTGFTGPDCSTKSCPDNCNNKGRCVNGKCVCDTGFTGPDCSTQTCPNNCNDRGKCVNGQCVCDEGFDGPDCSSMTCPGNCNSKGGCVNGQCVCDPGFMGPDCSAKACPDNCNDRGRCVNGKCVCDSGYAGADCSTKSCPGNCNNRGKCVDGQCVCDAGFTGPDCSAKACPNNCSNKGRCVNGKCVCDVGLTGQDCSTKACPNNCNNKGRCVKGKCVCRRGFADPDCSECEAGFTGADCSTALTGVSRLSTTDITDSSATFFWTPPSVQYDTYHITLTSKKEGDQQITATVGGGLTTYTQTGLAPGQEYVVSVKGEKDGKMGSESTTEFTTLISGPKNLQVVKTSTTSVIVQWEPAQGEIDRYRLSVTLNQMDGSGRGSQETTLPPERDSAQIDDLEPGRVYDIALVAERDGSKSLPATVQAVPENTAKTVPGIAVETVQGAPGETSVRKKPNKTALYRKKQGRDEDGIPSSSRPDSGLNEDVEKRKEHLPARLRPTRPLLNGKDKPFGRPGSHPHTGKKPSGPGLARFNRTSTDGKKVGPPPLRKPVVRYPVGKDRVKAPHGNVKPTKPINKDRKPALTSTADGRDGVHSPVQPVREVPVNGTPTSTLQSEPYLSDPEDLINLLRATETTGPSKDAGSSDKNTTGHTGEKKCVKVTKVLVGHKKIHVNGIPKGKAPGTEKHMNEREVLNKAAEDPSSSRTHHMDAESLGKDTKPSVKDGHRPLSITPVVPATLLNLHEHTTLPDTHREEDGTTTSHSYISTYLPPPPSLPLPTPNPQPAQPESEDPPAETNQLGIDGRPTITPESSKSRHQDTNVSPPPSSLKDRYPLRTESPVLSPWSTKNRQPTRITASVLPPRKRYPSTFPLPPSQPSTFAQDTDPESEPEDRYPVQPVSTSTIKDNRKDMKRPDGEGVKEASEPEKHAKKDTLPHFRRTQPKGTYPRRPNVGPVQNRTRPNLRPPQHPSRGPIHRPFPPRVINRDNGAGSLPNPRQPGKVVRTNGSQTHPSSRIKPNFTLKRKNGTAILKPPKGPTGPKIRPHDEDSRVTPTVHSIVESESKTDTPQERSIAETDDPIDHVGVRNVTSRGFVLIWHAPKGIFRTFVITGTKQGRKDEEKSPGDSLEKEDSKEGQESDEKDSEEEEENDRDKDRREGERSQGSRGKDKNVVPEDTLDALRKKPTGKSTDDVLKKFTKVLPGSARSFPFQDLLPQTPYSVSLIGEGPGVRSKVHSLVITTGPEPPSNLDFSDVTENSLTVSWKKPKSPVTGFKVTYTHKQEGEPVSEIVDSKGSTLPLSKLAPGSVYEVSVISVLGMDESDPVRGTVQTLPDPPTNLQAINVTDTKALLLWRPALATVDRYVIVYGSDEDPGSEVTLTVSGNAAEKQLDALKESTQYTVTIISQLGNLRSTGANAIFTTTSGSAGVGDGPKDLTASQVTPRTAVLSWKPPSSAVTSYKLTYYTEGQEIQEVTLDPTVKEHKLVRLYPRSRYIVQLQAERGGLYTAAISTEFTTGNLRFPFPADCSQELQNGKQQSGIVEVFPAGRGGQSVMVYCDMQTDGGGWTVFQRRKNGKTNFFRPWRDYSRGFGDLDGEFWLGNELLHNLTKLSPMSLRVDLNSGTESVYAKYSSFSVGPQQQHYALRLSGYSGTAGDSMSYHSGRPFSTRDRDPQPFITRCAMSYRGGWWYKNCHEANLNGLYDTHTNHQGVIWTAWKGKNFSIPFVEMKFRPASFRP